MLYTPAALELALRCPFTGPFSSVGDDDKPEMAESTLVRSEGAASTDMLIGESVARCRCFFNEMILICSLGDTGPGLLVRGDNQARGNGQGGREGLERGLSRDHDRKRLRASDPTFRLFEGFWGN